MKRFNVWTCHRRFGKTALSLCILLQRAFDNPRPNPRYAYVAPLRTQAKAIAWDLLKRLTKDIPDAVPSESELSVPLPNGARITLMGSDHPDTLRGAYWDGAVLDEYAQTRPRVWGEILRPTLADRQGWAIMISTPMGKNHFYDLYQSAAEDGWHRAMYTAEDTQVLPAHELLSARKSMAPEQYAQEFMCSFESALIGSYYGAYLETVRDEQRLTRVPWEPSVPVHTAWDLGVSDSTAIWFVQPVGKMLHVIDYLEASDRGLEWYSKVLKEKPYTYGRHYFPHDMINRDFSGNGRTRQDIAESLGLRPAVIVPRGNTADGIAAVRTMFPRFLFDEDRCYSGIEALKSYRREWNEQRKTWGDKPLHDWSSHAADALRCFAVGYKETSLIDTSRYYQLPPVFAGGTSWQGR